MKCAIHQPQFLPWLGYTSKIRSADVFVFLDNVQFKKNEFQNRTRIRMQDAAHWLTVPVSFRFGDTLKDVRIASDPHWNAKIMATLRHCYARAPHFKTYEPELAEILGKKWNSLAELNQSTVEWLMTRFGIATKALVASQLPEFSQDPTLRLVEICKFVGADTYLSGAGGRDYLEIPTFERAGLKLEFQDFLHPTYKQCYGDPDSGFVPRLSGIDALFNCGGEPR